MNQLKNDRLLRAINHQPVDRTPIWIMRQAGRYLPEYRAVRQQAGSFLALCKNPELACEVSLQPLARFSLDAAIVFSDILTIPDAMGLGLRFIEGEGPVFDRPLRTARDIQNLAIPDPEMSLSYVLDAIRLITRELAGKVPLIGFCGSPWTMATYMVEGTANKTFPQIRSMLERQPHLLHMLLHKLAESVSLHLNAQIKAGAEVVMIFDTWGGMLNTLQYQEFSLNYMKQIMANIHSVPVILFTKSGNAWLELMAQSGCQVIAVDWLTNLTDARKRVGNKVALQGNLNPSVLRQSEEIIRAEVARVLAEYGEGSGHIFNLGHGITPDIPPEHVSILVDAVQTLSSKVIK